jgi:hypothetical protein
VAVPKPPTRDSAELAELRAEIARLNAELELAQLPIATIKAKTKRDRVWRIVVASVLILIGVVLTPTTMAAAWAATELSNTDRFVQSLAPLSQDPAVRTYLGDEVIAAIEKRVDISGLTSDAFDGLASAGLPPRASTALQALAPAAASGLKGLLGSSVHKVIDSPQFEKVWVKALTASHKQLDNILNDNQDSAIVVNDTGAVGIRLAPIIAKVKSQLESTDFPLATSIPAVNVTVEVGTVKNIAPLRAAYHLLLVLVGILPWVCIVCLVAGIAIAPHRALAAMWTGIALAVAVALTLAALAIAIQAIGVAASTHGVPQAVTHTLLGSLTTQISAAGVGVIVIGVVLALGGFFAGRSRPARNVRRATNGVLARFRSFLSAHHLWSPRLGGALHAARYAIWFAILLLALIALYASLPLTIHAVVLTLVVAGIVLIIFAILEAPTSWTELSRPGPTVAA